MTVFHGVYHPVEFFVSLVGLWNLVSFIAVTRLDRWLQQKGLV